MEMEKRREKCDQCKENISLDTETVARPELFNCLTKDLVILFLLSNINSSINN